MHLSEIQMALLLALEACSRYLKGLVRNQGIACRCVMLLTGSAHPGRDNCAAVQSPDRLRERDCLSLWADPGGGGSREAFFVQNVYGPFT